MRTITNDFKTELKTMGKEIDARITYTINGTSYTLGADDLNSVKPHYKGGILKSTMKELEIDSNTDIPLGTIIECQFGIKVNGSFEYMSYGHYVVYSSEKQEDLYSYKITCYDKMLYSMKDYEKLQYRNLFDKDTENYKKGYYLNSSGVETSGTNWGTYYIKVKPNTSYTISGCQTNGGVQFCWFNSNKTFISAIGQKQDRTNITSPSNAGYIGLSIVWNTTSSAYDGTTFMLQEGSTATDYEPFGDIQYPISVRKYIDLLCFNIGLTFKNANDYFTNYDKTIDKELYLDENGNSLNYTYRDVLDELAQVTASTICINEDDDELEIRYITNAGETTTNTTGTNLSITSEDSQVNNIQLLGNTTQNGTPTPSSPVEVQSITGRQEVKCVGKNLYYIEPQTLNGVTLSYDNDGAIVLNGTSTSSFTAFRSTISLNGNYTLSAKASSAQSSTYIRTRNASSTIGHNIQLTSTNQLTATANVQISTLEITIGANGIAYNNFKIYVQLESGGSFTTYEPYKEETNEINLGKNLINIQNIVKGRVDSGNVGYASNTTDLTLNSNDVSFTTNANYRGIATELISVSPNTTYYYNATNSTTIAQYIDYYDNSKTWVSKAVSFSTSYKQFTTNNNTYYIRMSWQLDSSGTATIEKPQLEKSNIATSYSPYFTPIELCKIGTYQDKIFKNSGKNLINPNSAYTGTSNGITTTYNDDQSLSFSGTASSTWGYLTNKINLVKPSGNYTFSIDKSVSAHTTIIRCFYDSSNYQDITINKNTTSRTANLTNGIVAYQIYIAGYTSGTAINDTLHFQLQTGSTATDFEPYGNGEWYVKKAIGKVVLDGSETWYYRNDISNTNTYCFRTNANIIQNIANIQPVFSNNFICLNDTTDVEHFRYSANVDGYALQLFINKTRVNGTTPSLLQTWLSTHNTIVYYVKATPTYTKLNDTLQEQLNSIRLLEGLNNITTNVPIDLTYVSGIDTLDEEYFNEDNVNFGEMYGPVNTIILSRSAESDEIAQSIPSNLSDDEKVAIKIKENQIMNFNNRDEYLYGILTRLYGLRYTQNDYSSKGICYYNICDRYKATIFGKDYYCVMLNDDVTIESGLSENVFTELPEVAETDYSKTSTSDRIERQTNLIVDKQAGEIRGEISTIDTQINGANGISSKLTSQGQTIDLWSKSFDDNGNVIALNTTNYTFDSEGLKIGKSTDDYNSLQDNTGTYYYEKDTMIGKYTKDGSVQKDLALYGKYYYGIDEESQDFNVATFERSKALFLAQLYNDGTEDGFGHFWNGE